MATIGIYKRVSTDEQSLTGISLDNQEKRGIDLSLKMGYDYEIYTDAGMSGTIPFDKRPGLNKLLNDIIDKKIDAIFVLDIDRLSRGDIIQTTLIKNILKDNNAKLYDVNSEIDLNDPNQELLSDMRSLLSAYEIKKTSARIKSVLEQNVIKGKASGGPLLPFGFRKDELKKLLIDDKEAEIVRLIYNLSLDGKGTKVISNILNEKKIPTKRTTAKKGQLKVRGVIKDTFIWRDSVVYRILTNPIYKGERIYKNKTFDCPIIIDPIVFDLVQEKMKEKNQFKNTKNKYTYFLKGLIYCSRCKGRFYGHKRENGKDNAYVCISKRYGKSCGNVGISIDFLDNLVIENILDLNHQIEVFFDDVRNQRFLKSQLLKIDDYKIKIKECSDSINNLLNIAQQAGIDPQTFKQRFEMLNSRLVKLKEEQTITQKNTGILNNETEIKEYVKKSINDFKKIKDDENKIKFIRNFISAVYIQWNEDELTHYVAVNYKIDKLTEYQIAKEILVNRTGVDLLKKRKIKILKEELAISSISNYVPQGILRIKYTS